MSREGAGAGKPEARRATGTPIWVWVIYVLGILAASIFVLSMLFTLGAVLLSDDVDVTYDISTLAIALWGGIVLAAAVTWIVRRSRR